MDHVFSDFFRNTERIPWNLAWEEYSESSTPVPAIPEDTQFMNGPSRETLKAVLMQGTVNQG